MSSHLERLCFNLEVNLYREKDDPKNVLVCFSIDHHAEQRHLLQSGRVPVSTLSLIECLAKVIRRIIEGSAFDDASSPRETQTVQAEQER